MSDKKYKPDRVPENAGAELTTRVLQGVTGGHDGLPGQYRETAPRPTAPQRRRLTVDEYVQGVLSGDRNVLARTITLVESPVPRSLAKALMRSGK